MIQLVNYWPDVELDDYIKLKGRVEARMKVTVMTATGDDNLLSDEEKGDLQYRKEQLKRLQEEVVDIEDMDTGINIMDLGLNEFRLDLLAYMKDNPDIAHTPLGMSAVVGSSDFVQPGVIYVLKNRNNGVNINNQNIANVLDRLLATQGLAYTINEKHIVIYKTNEKASHPMITDNKKITGKVLSLIHI